MSEAADLDVVVVGASLGGVSTARALRRGGHRGTITLVGSETRAPYDRPPLTKNMLTDPTVPNVELVDELDAGLRFVLGRSAVSVDVHRRQVELDDGQRLDFGGLVIATGARARRLPGSDHLKGVHVVRTLDDALALRADLASARSVAVIGAGFIGGEVAASCRALGLDVTLLDVSASPHEPIVGPQMAALCLELHQRHGVRLLLGTAVTGLIGEDRVQAVALANGQQVEADVVVIGIGVVPDVGWLNDADVLLDDGVSCDERLRVLSTDATALDQIVAVGDACRWKDLPSAEARRVEHWDTTVAQAEAAAQTLLYGNDAPPFLVEPYFWSDQYGVKIQFAGRYQHGDSVEIVDGDPATQRFAAEYRRDGQVVAALAFSRPSRIMRYRRLLEDQKRSHVLATTPTPNPPTPTTPPPQHPNTPAANHA